MRIKPTELKLVAELLADEMNQERYPEELAELIIGALDQKRSLDPKYVLVSRTATSQPTIWGPAITPKQAQKLAVFATQLYAPERATMRIFQLVTPEADLLQSYSDYEWFQTRTYPSRMRAAQIVQRTSLISAVQFGREEAENE